LGNLAVPSIPGSSEGKRPASPESLLGGERQPQGADPSRDALRALTSQAASLQQQFMEMFGQFPATARYMRDLQAAVRGALMAATQTLTQNREGPQPLQMG
jgi:hypothetical protein